MQIAVPTSLCAKCGHQSTLDLIKLTPLAFPQNQANYIPILSEESKIRESIRMGREDICSLNREIERLGSVIKQLEARREEISVYVLEQQAILSPIRRLPAETLSEIFKFYLGNRPIDLVRSTLNPWRLGQTCHYWRDIVLSLPTLWSNFEIHHSSKHESIDSFDRSYRRLESCLRHSCKSPLTFSFDMRLTEPSNENNLLWPRLVSECHRWRDATIQDYTRFPPSAFKGSVPILKSLHLSHTRHSDGTSSDVFADFDFEHAPNLSTVELTHIKNPASRLRLPWSQITRLKISGFPSTRTDDIPTLFALIPNIVILSLRLPHEPSFAVFPPFTFAHLEELGLEGYMSSLYLALLRGINAPQLTHLKLKIDPLQNLAPTDFVSSVSTLLQQSLCSLTRLTIVNLPAEMVCRMTEFTTALETLSFSSTRGYLHLLLRTGEDCSFPSLIKKTLSGRLGFGINVGNTALDMLLSHIENDVLKFPHGLQNLLVENVESSSIKSDTKDILRRAELFNTRGQMKLALYFI